MKEKFIILFEEGKFKEFGEHTASTGQDDVFKMVLSKAKKGEFSSITAEYPDMYLRYKNTIESCRSFDF